MKDQQILDWIDRDLDGELAERESKALQQFLAAHEDWRRYYESLRRIEETARSAPLIHPSPGFADRVMDRIKEQVSEGAKSEGFREEETVVSSDEAHGVTSTVRGENPSRRLSPGRRRDVWGWAGIIAALAAILVLSATAIPLDFYNSGVAAGIGWMEALGQSIAPLIENPGLLIQTQTRATKPGGVLLGFVILFAAFGLNYWFALRIRTAHDMENVLHG